MLENRVERALIKMIRSLGGVCWKWTSPGTSGVPDRICILPGGRDYFVEVKSPTGQLDPLQKQIIKEFARLGRPVYVVSSLEDIRQLKKLLIIDEIQSA
jgi:hypothetical protein